MKKRRTTNKKLTTSRDQQKKHIIRGVVKRGANPQLQAAGRSVWRIFKIAFRLAVVVALIFGVRTAYSKLFWENPDYALSDIAFVTDGSLARDQALAVAKLQKGKNIYSYDLNAACEALKAMPQVEKAEVRRYLPSRIEVTVTERKPVAWVMNDEKEERTHLLDARGLVFQPKRALPDYERLPVITGVETGDLVPGKPIRKFELIAALELIRLTRQGGDTQILSVDLSKGFWMVATDQQHAKLTFGLDDIPGQLQNLALIRNTAKSRQDEIESVNLMVGRNVPVTLVQPNFGDDEIEAFAERPKVVTPEQTPKPSAPKPAPVKKAEPAKPRTTPGPPAEKSLLKKFPRAA